MKVMRIFQIEAKMFCREFIAVFFTIFFCPLMLILFGVVYGNDPTPFYDGLGTIDVSVPAFTALIFCGNGIISFPIAIASAKESGELRRYQITPFSPFMYVLTQMIIYLLMSYIGTAVMVLVGTFVYNTQFSGSVPAVILGLLISGLSVFSIGLLVAALSKSAKMAQAIGMIIGFPMMFLSGASMPVETMPDSMIEVVQYFPVFHEVKLMRALWIGKSMSSMGNSILYLLAVMVGCFIVSVVIFRRNGGKES